jgi:menaquinone-9 beta-reductase
MTGEIQIAGAGPAGTAAAIAARSEGAGVHIYERARTARHKVCGEFVSHEAFLVLEQLGVSRSFLALQPPVIRRCALHIGARRKEWKLAEPAYGLSRLALDGLLLDHAVAAGAQLSRGAVFQTGDGEERVILASGRRGLAARGGRLFGFKAHYEGPPDDAVELYFTRFGYVGMSAIEGGLTNVCGLASEEALARHGFDIDALLAAEPAVSAHLQPLSRRMAWLKTGPLSFSRVTKANGAPPRIYPAGDGLGFIDPFTGSGILNAVLTGRLAGIAAATGKSAAEHLRACARLLDGPFATSAALRALLRTRLRELAVFIPGNWLYNLTRAHVLGAIDA